MQALLFAHLGKLTLSSTQAGSTFSWPKLVGGDDITLKLRFVQDQDGAVVLAQRTVSSIKCSIGRQQYAPEDGTFQLKLGSDPESAGVNTTAALAYNISAANLAAALNALTDPALSAAKPFTVSERDGSYLIAAADRSEITWSVADNELWPASKCHVAERDYDEGYAYELRLIQVPVAQVTSFGSIVPAVPTMTQIRAGATNSGVITTELQQLFVPPENPAGFSFCLKRGFRKTAPIVVGENDTVEALTELLNAKATSTSSGFVDEGEQFNVYAAPDGAIIEWAGDLAGTNQDLLEIEVIAEAPADTVFTLSTKTPLMATLLRKASSTTKEIAAVLHLTVWLEDEQDEDIDRPFTFHVPVTLQMPVNMDDLAAAADINWVNPLSRESYVQHTPDQILTGQRHFIDESIGDGTSDEITITHSLATRYVHVDVQETAADGHFLSQGRVADGAEYEIEIVSDNAIKLIFAAAPGLNALRVQITSAAHDANYEAHTHTIDEITDLETRLTALEEAVATLQENAAVQSVGSRDAEAGTKLLEVQLPKFVDAYPMKTSLLAAAQAAAPLANASTTQVSSASGTTTTTTGSPQTVSIESIRDIAPSILPKDGDLLGALHDAALEALPGTLPTPGAANKGKVYQNRTAASVRLPGGGGRKSVDLRPGELAASDGRRLFRVMNPTVDLARTFTAAVDDTITLAQHGYANTQRVRVFSTGTLPAGLSADTDYYVIDAATNTFKLSASSGGAAIDITDTGTGTHYLHTAPLKTSYYPADFERELFITHVNSDALQVKKTAEWKFGLELAILNKKTQAPLVSEKITRGQWRLVVEIGTPLAEDAPATADANIKRITWQSTPLLDKTLFLTNDTPAVHTFGARVKRTAADAFTVEKNIYGNWSASAATLATADFFLRARLTQWDVEDLDDAEGFVVLLGLDKVIEGDTGDMGKLIVK